MNIAKHITKNAKAPLNILILNWRFPSDKEAGGAEVHLASMMEDLIALGHSVTLVASRPRFGHREGVERVEQVREIEAGRWFSAHFAIPRAARRLLKEESFDLVVDDVNKIPFEAPRWSSVPVVAVFHHLLGHTLSIESNAAVAAYIGNKEKRIGAVYQGTPAVAVSNQTKFELTELGLKKSDIEVIPPTTPDTKPLRNVRRTKEPTILVLSRLRAYKRVDFAIDVFREIAEDHPTARLIIAGEGPEETKLKKQAEDLSERIEFMGYVSNEEKRTLLHECWIGLCPSEKEGWGIVPREMLDSGMTVLASDVAGHRESVNGPNGQLLAIDDERSWRQSTLLQIDSLKRRTAGLDQEAVSMLRDQESPERGLKFSGDESGMIESCPGSHRDFNLLPAMALFVLVFSFLSVTVFSQSFDKWGRHFPDPLQPHILEMMNGELHKLMDPVFPQNGEFAFTVSDLSVETVGLPVVFQRTYRSKMVYHGDLGHRSDHNFNMHLIKDSSTTLKSYPGAAKEVAFTYDATDQKYYPDSGGIYEYVYLSGSFMYRVVQGGTTFKYASPATDKWRLVEISDRRGRAIDLTYNNSNADGQLTKVENDEGDGIELIYGTGGYLSRVKCLTDTNKVVEYDYTSNELTSVTAMPGLALEQVVSYEYETGSTHRIITVTDPGSNKLTTPKPRLRNYYDTSGRVEYQEYGNNVSDGSSDPPTDPAYQIVYGSSFVTYKDREGREFNYYYDANDLLTKQVQVSASGNITEEYEYYSSNLLKKETRADGSTVEYTYDSSNSDFMREGDLLSRTVKDSSGANASTASWVTHASGWGHTQVTHSTGQIDKWEYDAVGNQTKQILDFGGIAQTTTYSYSDATEYYRLEKVTAPGSVSQSFEYDANNRLTKIINDSGTGKLNIVSATNEYDSLGRLTATIDAEGLKTIFSLDDAGRTTKVEVDAAGGGESETFYDADGRITKQPVNFKVVVAVHSPIMQRLRHPCPVLC